MPLPILILVAALSLVALVHLWLCRRSDTVARRLFWSVVILLPLFGPFFYGGMYKLPTKNDVDPYAPPPNYFV